eukprot:CAMPEP_0119389040 /NCGR_PEP_ID=MMETSP1334-20130426/107467_1 /TAXON_ID=127549 /ORGANISM="Calcidiscus leptoporus, Strain RCC1130" /LENGTH=87 /DNA_ID=CAMNT_0007411175 /DNA_START=300 /DNA_END=561 /DNA_ORIENTATION=-
MDGGAVALSSSSKYREHKASGIAAAANSRQTSTNSSQEGPPPSVEVPSGFVFVSTRALSLAPDLDSTSDVGGGVGGEGGLAESKRIS